MLAPLKDRSIIEQEPADEPKTPAALQMEIDDLRYALRESRNRLRKSAWDSTRMIALIQRELSRWKDQSIELERKLHRYENGQAMIEMGQQLMRYATQNDRLQVQDSQRAKLEQALGLLTGELQHVLDERDQLQRELHQLKLERVNN